MTADKIPYRDDWPSAPGGPYWRRLARLLGVPWDWTLRPRRMADGRWKLRASGREPMPCGHRSMEVTAGDMAEAVARMAHSLRFHESEEWP